MTTLLFGGSGFIGRAISTQLALQGEPFVIADLQRTIENAPFAYCDLTSADQTLKIISDIRPKAIINLAARTDDKGKQIQDYSVNYYSVANIVSALQKLNNLDCHLFHFSTQYVIGPEASPSHEFDYNPFTTYGESKMLSELILTSSNCNWTILRPTAVWGPFHPGYPKSIWPLVRKRMFIQPKTDPLRSYIYVNKLALAFSQIVDKPRNLTNGKVFYLGNQPESQRQLFNQWEKYITGGKIWTIPKFVFELIYQVARILEFLKFEFPLNKTRYQIFTQDYLVNLESTHQLIGEIPKPNESDYLETFTWYSQSF